MSPLVLKELNPVELFVFRPVSKAVWKELVDSEELWLPFSNLIQDRDKDQSAHDHVAGFLKVALPKYKKALKEANEDENRKQTVSHLYDKIVLQTTDEKTDFTPYLRQPPNILAISNAVPDMKTLCQLGIASEEERQLIENISHGQSIL